MSDRISRRIRATLVAAFLAAAVANGEAVRAGEAAYQAFIPKPVEFAPPLEDVTSAGLRGRTVIVLFFQSWCPLANRWSKGVFRDAEAAWGLRDDIVLMALKTDGGSFEDARKYLTDRDANPDLWILGLDHDGIFQQKVFGAKSLYNYAVYDGRGALRFKKSAGSYYATADGGEQYVIGTPELAVSAGFPATGKKWDIPKSAYSALTCLRSGSPGGLAAVRRRAENDPAVRKLLDAGKRGLSGHETR